MPCKKEDKQEIKRRLKEGEILHVYSRRDPCLPYLGKLESEGKIEVEIEGLDEQSSRYSIMWIPKKYRPRRNR